VPLTDALVIIPSHTSQLHHHHTQPTLLTISSSVSRAAHLHSFNLWTHQNVPYSPLNQSIGTHVPAREIYGWLGIVRVSFRLAPAVKLDGSLFHCLFDAFIIPYHTFSFSLYHFFFFSQLANRFIPFLRSYIELVLFFFKFSLAHGYVSRHPDILLMGFGFPLWCGYCTICTPQIVLLLPHWPDPLAPPPLFLLIDAGGVEVEKDCQLLGICRTFSRLANKLLADKSD